MARPYMKREDRRRQIVEVTVRLIAEYGVEGATLSKIAAGVGVTTAAIYGHFTNRREILLEAMDYVCGQVSELRRQARSPDALERLREIGRGHAEMVSGKDGFAACFIQFCASPPHEGLREAMGERELKLVEELVQIVREGQAEGSIRQDADPYQVAWTMVSRAWTEDVSYLMGIAEQWHGLRSDYVLEALLASIAEPGDGESQSERVAPARIS